MESNFLHTIFIIAHMGDDALQVAYVFTIVLAIILMFTTCKYLINDTPTLRAKKMQNMFICARVGPPKYANYTSIPTNNQNTFHFLF